MADEIKVGDLVEVVRCSVVDDTIHGGQRGLVIGWDGELTLVRLAVGDACWATEVRKITPDPQSGGAAYALLSAIQGAGVDAEMHHHDGPPPQRVLCALDQCEPGDQHETRLAPAEVAPVAGGRYMIASRMPVTVESVDQLTGGLACRVRHADGRASYDSWESAFTWTPVEPPEPEYPEGALVLDARDSLLVRRGDGWTYVKAYADGLPVNNLTDHQIDLPLRVVGQMHPREVAS